MAEDNPRLNIDDDGPEVTAETLEDLLAGRKRDAGAATQIVPGVGPRDARLMIVSKQPGDQEDLQSLPFVGPAGKVLDAALERAGIDRSICLVTNAVKHFKFEPRGKRRLHKTPNAYEIDLCRWWLEHERRIVRPELIVALGATAARSVFGQPMKIGEMRGRLLISTPAAAL